MKKQYNIQFLGGQANTCKGFCNYMSTEIDGEQVIVEIDVDIENDRVQGLAIVDGKRELFDVDFRWDTKLFIDDAYFDEFTYPILKQKIIEIATRLGVKETQLNF
ncbi:MAG TPA: hypothetical protein DCW90_09380 [Lachnospiraceae bacterium]|nr:hypothetical protein [Lachnospiraceae bacterium]